MKASIISPIVILLAASLVACNSGIDKNNEDQQYTPAATTVLPSLQSDSLQAPATSQPATAAVNPPHGAPGHRCDVAVGAPLPASGAATATPPVSNAPINITPSAPLTSPVQSSGTVRLNPPHGQPGHDCAVEVGQPLR